MQTHVYRNRYTGIQTRSHINGNQALVGGPHNDLNLILPWSNDRNVSIYYTPAVYGILTYHEQVTAVKSTYQFMRFHINGSEYSYQQFT